MNILEVSSKNEVAMPFQLMSIKSAEFCVHITITIDYELSALANKSDLFTHEISGKNFRTFPPSDLDVR